MEQDGFGFDLGPSILTIKPIFEKLFTHDGKQMDDYVETVEVESQWRSFFPNGTIIDLYSDLEKMAQQNPALTEKDMAEYQTFLQYAKKLYEVTEEGYFEKGLDDSSDVLSYHGIIHSLTAFDLTSTMYHAIDTRISNPKLRDMLAYFIKYVGSSPYDAPAVLNMIIYMQHAQGI